MAGKGLEPACPFERRAPGHHADLGRSRLALPEFGPAEGLRHIRDGFFVPQFVLQTPDRADHVRCGRVRHRVGVGHNHVARVGIVAARAGRHNHQADGMVRVFGADDIVDLFQRFG